MRDLVCHMRYEDMAGTIEAGCDVILNGALDRERTTQLDIVLTPCAYFVLIQHEGLPHSSRVHLLRRRM